MLVADGGGGYGGTDWMGMDVIQMWQAVENQDTTAHYQLLTGWRKSYELTLEHLSQVQNYRQSLAEAWPPETSAASAAYIQRLDDLITNLQATYDAAVANHDAFANATLAISMSRDDVKKIYDEYTANQAKLAEFKNQPRPVSKFPVPPQKPPVADGRQEQLNNQARTVMFGLSGEILQAKSQIVKPALYDPRLKRRDGEGHEDTPIAAPPVPPVGTYDPSSSSGGRGDASHASSTRGSTSGADVNTQVRAAGNPGLILTGTQPSQSSLLPPNASTELRSPIAGGGIPHVVPPAPPVALPPGMALPRNLPSGIATNRDIPPPAAMEKGFFKGSSIRAGLGGLPEGELRGMPPGAVIGGMPTTLGPSRPGTRPPSRVNPVGGVIGPRNAENAHGSQVRSSTPGQPLGVVPGRTDRRNAAEKKQRWDPDNPWTTEEGVSPVLLPTEPQRVDPGPAIGLR